MPDIHKCAKFMCANYIAKNYGYSARRARALAKDRGIEHSSTGPRGQKLWDVEKINQFAPMPPGRPPTGRVKR